eukprot:m.78521 g.78521  ORF g.78521 m.78521 type:complete len:430 (+) comp50583_c0_seq1:72-1361(+)
MNISRHSLSRLPSLMQTRARASSRMNCYPMKDPSRRLFQTCSKQTLRSSPTCGFKESASNESTCAGILWKPRPLSTVVHSCFHHWPSLCTVFDPNLTCLEPSAMRAERKRQQAIRPGPTALEGMPRDASADLLRPDPPTEQDKLLDTEKLGDIEVPQRVDKPPARPEKSELVGVKVRAMKPPTIRALSESDSAGTVGRFASLKTKPLPKPMHFLPDDGVSSTTQEAASGPDTFVEAPVVRVDPSPPSIRLRQPEAVSRPKFVPEVRGSEIVLPSVQRRVDVDTDRLSTLAKQYETTGALLRYKSDPGLNKNSCLQSTPYTVAYNAVTQRLLGRKDKQQLKAETMDDLALIREMASKSRPNPVASFQPLSAPPAPPEPEPFSPPAPSRPEDADPDNDDSLPRLKRLSSRNIKSSFLRALAGSEFKKAPKL